MTERLKCGKSPCHSCPYRRDVPGGVWAENEYEKLPLYDGSLVDQLVSGATGVFLCHAQPGRLCAGWVGTHDMTNNLAVQVAATVGGAKIDPMIFTYTSPVPLFASGAEAAAHGLSSIENPSAEAKDRIALLLRKHEWLRDGHNAPLVEALQEGSS